MGPGRGSSLTGDFATVVYRQQLLGFNLVRLPFRFGPLRSSPRSTLAHSCALATRAELKAHVENPLPPFDAINYASLRLPSPRAPPPKPHPGWPACNWYLPDGSVLDRLMWAAQYYAANGFYVILDWHPATPDAEAAEDSALLADADALAGEWAWLASSVASLPAWRDGRLKGRLFFELVNEPDRLGVAWNDATVGRLNATALAAGVPTPRASPLAAPGANASAAAAARAGFGARVRPAVAAASATPSRRRLAGRDSSATAAAIASGAFNVTQRPLGELLLAAGTAVVAAAPGVLLIVQGTNQSHYTPPMAWGSAFITDPAVAADHAAQGRPYSDAAPFLEAWAARPELASVTALGPHVYGPSMAWSLADNTGAQAWKTLTATFGSGSAWARRFPVIITEFGSHLDTPGDAAWLRDFAAWANRRAPGAARPVAAWCWWQWAPTAWDTGGLVEDDWVTPRWDKIGNLTTTAAAGDEGGGGWWLRPWYLRVGRSG